MSTDDKAAAPGPKSHLNLVKSTTPDQPADDAQPAVSQNTPSSTSIASHDGFFATLTQLDDDDLIKRPRCKFCSHPVRFQSEEMWEKCKNYSSVAAFMNTWSGQNPKSKAPKMNIQNVRTHINLHYRQQMSRLYLREYAEKLGNVMSCKRADAERFQQIITALEIELWGIASDPGLDKIKKADSMVKLARQISDTYSLQSQLFGDIKATAVMYDHIVEVWSESINSQDDEYIKAILMQILEEFQKRMGGPADA
jgi:hypothetical protein